MIAQANSKQLQQYGLTPEYVDRLREHAEQSFIDLEPFRRFRKEACEQFAGPYYSDDGAQEELPVNMIQQVVELRTMLLSANNPQVAISTDVNDLRQIAGDWEAVTNNLIVEMRLFRKLKAWVRDAQLGIGILKSGIEVISDDEDEGPETEVFLENISIDNFVFDSRANSYEKVRYAGDFYQIEVSKLRAMGLDDEQVGALSPASWNDGPFGRREDRTEDIGGDRYQRPSEDDLEPVVNVWDFWLPDKGLICTIPDQQVDFPLLVRPWPGLRVGCYSILGFIDMPDNVLPIPMVGALRDLHRLINELWRKLSRQARRQKTNTVFPVGGESDSDSLALADDGENVFVSDPKNITQVSQGGVDQGNLAFAIHADDRLNRVSGNFDAMAGLGPQSDTVGQDQMIHGQLNAVLEKMGESLTEGTTEVIRGLSFLWWTDPTRIYEGMRKVQVPGLDLSVPIGPTMNGLAPEDREEAEKWFRFNFTVEPHSQRYMSPEMKLNKLYETLDRLGPHMPYMMEQGLVLDYERLLRQIAKWTPLPELMDLYSFMMQSPATGSERMAGEPPAMAPVTKRTYERVSRPGSTRQGRDSAMFSSLMGSPQQPAAGAAVMRPNG